MTRRKRTLLELTLALVIITSGYIFYRAEETNIAVWFENTFPHQTLILGQVVSVSTASSTLAGKTAYPIYDISVRILTGAHANETTMVIDEGLTSSTAGTYIGYAPGETVILAPATLQSYSGVAYYITDRFRLPSLLFIILLFIVTAIVFGRMRGFTAIVGLAASVAILGWYVVPQILNGADPILICLIAATAIAFISLYLAHGFNKRTSIALIGTLLSLGLSTLLAFLFVSLSHLIGLATEESFYLAVGQHVVLNLRGILLGGIIIGALGVLDDVTIGQATTIAELKSANNTFSIRELYERGMIVGREHIASLINTLFLAYAGVALPVILYIAAFQSQLPLWLTVNGEAIAEEIVRTLVGSIGIILAVPITTLIAAWAFSKKN
jgi:uncharacterized membrane protein